MSFVKNNIPVFSTWKMFNETVPVLLKGDFSEASVKKLATLIREFSNIFICNKDSSLTFEKYQEIGERYKAFTTWILGQLFYLLGCERFSKLHDVIVDTQLCVLDQLSHTQLHIYQEISEEYSKAFDLLIGYWRQPNDHLILELFVPQPFDDLSEKLDLTQTFMDISSKPKCLMVLDKLIKFIGFFLMEEFSFYSLHKYTHKNLDNLLFVLRNMDHNLKLNSFEIFLGILNKATAHLETCSVKTKDYFYKFVSLVEQFVFHVYSNSNTMQNKEKERFEELLISFFNTGNNYNEYIKNLQSLSQHIFERSVFHTDHLPSTNVQLASYKYLRKTSFPDDIVSNYIETSCAFKNSATLYIFKEKITKDICLSERNVMGIRVYEFNVSRIWHQMSKNILENLKELHCEANNCRLQSFFRFFKRVTTMLLEITLQVAKSQVALHFFEENELLLCIINAIVAHDSCSEHVTHDVFSSLISTMFLSNSKNINSIFSFIAYPLIKLHVSRNDNEEVDCLMENASVSEMKAARLFYKYLLSKEIDILLSLESVKEFFKIISSGLINCDCTEIQAIEATYLQICRKILEQNDVRQIRLVSETLPDILTLFENTDQILNYIWTPIIISQDKQVIDVIVKAVPQIICSSYSPFTKVLRLNKSSSALEVHFLCLKCFFRNNTDMDCQRTILQEHFDSDIMSIHFDKIRCEPNLGISMLKNILVFLSSESTNLKCASLQSLPSFSSHVMHFYSEDVATMWVKLAGDANKDVRHEFSQVVGKIIKHCQENALLSTKIKNEIIRAIFQTLLNDTKRSLKYSDFELQNSLLSVIEEIIQSKCENLHLDIIKILLYFVMVPTSKYSLTAVNKCFKLAKKNDTNPTTIYSQYKKEICEVIAHLCSVNQALINYSLSTSLEKVSLMLGFYGSKDFVSQECNYILPFLIAKINKMPAVAKLVEEMATLTEMDISELLACKYGYIFIHLFLEMSQEDFKRGMVYLEKITGVTGPSLRKRNFRIILNELLLSFHEKNEKVVLALALLTAEDSENKSSTLADYLQPHFLGVLLYFDVKLISKNSRKDKILNSLADLLRYMGSKHIMPLRFKIIAMLQTTTSENFPELNAEVWDAFIHTCEIESLGPQIALIVISILPLLEYCPRKVNNILKYLIIQNENHTKSHIPDLFFLNGYTVDHEVLIVVKKYLKQLEQCSLREKIKRFLKYLTHEATEVRIKGLQHLKGFLEENREELDKMILDYNGIDPTIVELIDILTMGCRENDEALKLACGQVIGELGAIEPSHFPRRYANDERSFSFYINEDSFIISTLNELIKALQTEKHTQSMDRYALAIQEILKEYDISPNAGSSRYYLWREFPETHQEVMLPLLSSRYMIAQSVLVSSLPTPIYGSNSGASFESWLYNWTCSLISALPNERKDLLKVCLPSMKNDKRILMHLLPHILVHALLEGGNEITEKSFSEIQTITSSFTKQRTLDQKVLNLRPIPIPGISAERQLMTPEEVKQMQCTKVVFLLLDFLDQWIREWQWQKGLAGSTYEHFLVLKNFQNRLCKLQLAKCNYHCGEYPRALMYIEDYIAENKNEISNHLSFLAEIYAQLEEPDGVDGVTALQQNEPSVEQRILALEVSGKLADATTFYEQMMQPLKLQHIRGLVQCYLDLDNINTALNFVRGALETQPEFENMLLEMQAEPLWRLGQYEELNDLLHKPEMVENKSWGVQIGKALISFKNGDHINFEKVLHNLSKQQVEAFGAASLEEGAYQHGYGYISKLHALNELQQVEKIVSDLLLKPNDQRYAENLMKKLKNEWLLRIKVVQESVCIVEPLLCLRRVSLNLAKKVVAEKMRNAIPYLDDLIGECWLLSSRTARKIGMHQQAYTYTVKAEEFAPPTLFLEKAKLHWLREEHEQALTTLRRGLKMILPSGTAGQDYGLLTMEQRKTCAEARLLIASYNDSMSNVEAEVNLQNYRKANDVFKEWEKSLVRLAQYYDKIFQTLPPQERDTKGNETQLWIINCFGKSLHYGTTYIYQSMPCLLSIWFDYGTRMLDITHSAIKEERKAILLQMTKLIDSFLESLPPYVFLTAFSQLVSRICHPQKEVYGELKLIIIKLVQHFPQQSLWMIISVIKSSYSVRSKRCAEILSDPRLKSSTLIRLVKDFTSLAEKLIELCNKEIPSDVSTASVNQLLRALPRLLSKGDFSEIMMPTFKFRKLILPNPDFSSTQHNPFPNQYVHIVGINDEINILTSLQRPRKISLRGSDGKSYIFMLKPKDDLRKDFRLMEFNDIVNHLLTRDAESRQRRLNIRLYSVAPLNEECGLIEWVPNLIGLRPVLMTLYKQRGLAMKARELKESCCNVRDSLEKKRDTFLKKLLPRHPPILGEWFRKTFPDAQSWLTARTAYIRTTAVMSIAGYILGLGDRHGENILLDSTCGDAVHVDFNCLFNKGEKFDWPERVPFRLTHNMVAAMGPLSVEGMFRKSCGCTLRVLRMNTNTLMSIVTPFVYDPLVSWPRNMSVLPSINNPERTNEEAVDHIKNIELRLQGKIKSRQKTVIMPLSVEGQTNHLITEAISLDNLCQMYIGWGPYL